MGIGGWERLRDVEATPRRGMGAAPGLLALPADRHAAQPPCHCRSCAWYVPLARDNYILCLALIGTSCIVMWMARTCLLLCMY